MSDKNACPVCGETLVNQRQDHDSTYFECRRCSPYSLSGTALSILDSQFRDNKKAHARLSHAIFKMSLGPGHWPRISSSVLQEILADPIELPFPGEQLDNLIQWLGTAQLDPGDWTDEPQRAIAATGAIDSRGLGFIVSQAASAGLIDGAPKFIRTMSGGHGEYAFVPMQLTMQGWLRFGELLLGRSASRIAFMAMPFGEADLDNLFRDTFVPAVEQTGFTLKRLDDNQPAGLIDDRLRVEIRQSRFLISDLTDRNPGAYWEAGYAEGLGKHVIYTCRKDVFDNQNTKPHFDTNHHLTVVWDPSDLDVAAEKLKSTIRATLPDEARLED